MQIINKDGKSFVSELHIPSADRWLEVEIIPSDENYLVVILSDKTNETRHRHKSEQFQHQYKMIFDNSLLGIFRYDQFGIIMEANDAFIEILGSSREKLIGLNTTKLPDDRIRDAIQLTLKGSRERVYGKYTATTSGREVDVNSFFSPIELNEMVVGGFGIVRDVSERLRIQRELEENEYNLNYAQQLAEMGSWETTADGKQLDWSENYYRLLGLQPFSTPPDNALFFSKVHPEDIQLFTLDQSALVSNPETIEFEFRIVLDGGQIRWMKNSIHPIVENGKLVRLKGINIDITELKAVQLQLEKSLQEKDTLLSEVHHRVKNNLAIISSLLQLQTDLTDPGINQQVLLDSVSRIRSMALIHELIYRQETFSKLRVDEFMYQFISIVSDNYASSATKVETRLQTHEIQLDIDKAIPFSLITNELLTNAYKHAFKGRPDGLIVIELKSTDNEVQLKICDDGVGLGDSFRAKTGETLGTSLVYGLVEQLNGQVTFENVPSGGTCITVKFSCTE
jgi:PAS domain S-box-containing protein